MWSKNSLAKLQYSPWSPSCHLQPLEHILLPSILPAFLPPSHPSIYHPSIHLCTILQSSLHLARGNYRLPDNIWIDCVGNGNWKQFGAGLLSLSTQGKLWFQINARPCSRSGTFGCKTTVDSFLERERERNLWVVSAVPEPVQEVAVVPSSTSYHSK